MSEQLYRAGRGRWSRALSLTLGLALGLCAGCGGPAEEDSDGGPAFGLTSQPLVASVPGTSQGRPGIALPGNRPSGTSANATAPGPIVVTASAPSQGASGSTSQTAATDTSPDPIPALGNDGTAPPGSTTGTSLGPGRH
jgi:hypothetical protein